MTLLRICLESAALAGAVALACYLVPRMRAGHKAILWWLVAAKLLIGLVPLPAVEVPALATPRSIPVVAAATPSAAIEAPDKAPPAPPAKIALEWGVKLWILGAAAFMACAVPGWLRARQFRRSGKTIDDAAVALSVSRAAHRVGLRREPRVLAVADLPGPLVTGFFSPRILLPADALRRLSSDELDMTLAHEMAHIARGDLWWGLVPALARRIFFFHPAAWIVEREYALAREAACDEAVLRPGADAFAYGRLLVRFASQTPASASIPMSPPTMLRRRLEMIESVVRRVPLSRTGWALVAVAALALIPVRLVAKETRIVAAPSQSASSTCVQIGKDADTAYVITNGENYLLCGDVSEIRNAERARGDGGEVIWFRVGGESWVIRDPEDVARGRRYFTAINQLSELQSEVAIAHAQLEAAQSKRVIEQSKVSAEQAERAQLERELARGQETAAEQQSAVSADEQRRRELVEQELQAAQAGQSADAREQRRRELVEAELRAAEQSATGDDAKRLHERRVVLSQRMQQMDERQGDFHEQQRQLGERMNRGIAEAQRALSEFLERSIKDGRAKRAN